MTLICACWFVTGCATNSRGGPDHGLTASTRLRIAEAAEASGDRQTAASLYLAASNDAPGDTAVQLRSAEGLARNDRPDGAEGVLQNRLKAVPSDLDLLRTLGAVQIMAGRPAQAVQTLSRVLTRQPDDARALADTAVALDGLHRHAEAQGLYTKALAQSPGDPVISNDLALSLLLSGRPAEARRVLAPFAATADLPQRVRTNLGIVDAASGDETGARTLLGTSVDPTDLATLTAAVGGAVTMDAGQK